jgi:hypothetical protein
VLCCVCLRCVWGGVYGSKGMARGGGVAQVAVTHTRTTRHADAAAHATLATCPAPTPTRPRPAHALPTGPHVCQVSV